MIRAMTTCISENGSVMDEEDYPSYPEYKDAWPVIHYIQHTLGYECRVDLLEMGTICRWKLVATQYGGITSSHFSLVVVDTSLVFCARKLEKSILMLFED